MRVTGAALDTGRTYDLFIFAVGYESRSSYILRSGLTANHAVGFPFPENRVGAYSENLLAAESAGATIVDLRDDDEFASSIRTLLQLFVVSRGAKVAVDVSSFSRARLAAVISELALHSKDVEGVEVDFLYAPATFTEPDLLPEGVLSAAPVSSEYRGRLRRSSIPIAAVLGLGYEPQRAIGASELIEPVRTWAFVPDSGDEMFESALRSANRQMLASLPAEDILTYPVLDPAATYYLLESFLFATRNSFRHVLLPMGPKIFAVCCMLLGLDEVDERPAVWRVGSNAPAKPRDAVEAGPIVGLRVIL